jgi:hypothetical protein
MCEHIPCCPAAESTRPCGAHVTASQPDQGWCPFCNGIVLFDDGGAILPGGLVLAAGSPLAVVAA